MLLLTNVRIYAIFKNRVSLAKGRIMITATKLRDNVYGILDEVLATGIPVEIERHGKHLKIVAVDKPLKLKNLQPIKNLIVGEPADLEKIDWSDEWKI